MKPASMVSVQTASSASEKTRSSALLSSFARWSSPRVQAKMEAAANTSTVEGRRINPDNLRPLCAIILIKMMLTEPLFLGDTFGSLLNALVCVPLSYLWGWWRSPFLAGAACSGGSRCHGRPQTQPCARQGRSAHWSSCPGTRNLEQESQKEHVDARKSENQEIKKTLTQ